MTSVRRLACYDPTSKMPSHTLALQCLHPNMIAYTALVAGANHRLHFEANYIAGQERNRAIVVGYISSIESERM